MELFNKLASHPRSPAGIERRILRATPAALTGGLLVLLLPSLVLRLTGTISWGADGVASMTDIYAMGAVLFYVNIILAVAVGTFVVMVMKGPGYVADAYPLIDSERPAPLQPRAAKASIRNKSGS